MSGGFEVFVRKPCDHPLVPGSRVASGVRDQDSEEMCRGHIVWCQVVSPRKTGLVDMKKETMGCVRPFSAAFQTNCPGFQHGRSNVVL